MKKNKFSKYISAVVILLLGLLFVAKFGKAGILRLYIETGIGNCKSLPILCMAPQEEIVNLLLDKGYLKELLLQKFGEIEIYLPKGFNIVKEKTTKIYHKKRQPKFSGNTCYLLYEKPNFFVDLFPQLTKQGIKDDYEFLNRTMYARIKNIQNLTDTFFVIMKSIFIPDLSEEKTVKMIKFSLGDKKGFINYNLLGAKNYFDCNVIDTQGNFFKIYIKDEEAKLDLDKALTIISTVKKI